MPNDLIASYDLTLIGGKISLPEVFFGSSTSVDLTIISVTPNTLSVTSLDSTVTLSDPLFMISVTNLTGTNLGMYSVKVSLLNSVGSNGNYFFDIIVLNTAPEFLDKANLTSIGETTVKVR